MNAPADTLSRPGVLAFVDDLNILHSLDQHEVETLGDRWPAFRDNPVGFLIRADDADRALIWAALEKRRWKATAAERDAKPHPSWCPCSQCHPPSPNDPPGPTRPPTTPRARVA